MLVGRTRELDGLEQMLTTAADGSGGIRVVCGQPGIGKTSLADEIAARARARGFAVGWGRAWETGGAPAYWPWIELLTPLAVGHAELPPQISALLERVAAQQPGEGTRADPARERFELFDAVSSFLRACARSAPLLLIFDDLHVTDVASLELLWFVARGLRTARLAVVATYRDAESRLAPVADPLARITREASVIALRPLSREEVAEFVRQDVGRYDAPLAAALLDHTEGNPLFLRETLNAVVADPRVSPLEALRHVSVAGGVLAMVRSRLAGSHPPLRALLDIAAVLGREVSLSLLAEVCAKPTEQVQDMLDEACVRGLLARTGDQLWAFPHVLVREAFYQGLPEADRRGFHAAVASALQRRVERGNEQHLATLAHHALAAVPHADPAYAVRIARLAAEHARAQLAYEEAIALLERALSTCERCGVSDHERAEVEIALGWATTEAGRLERGRDLFRDAARIARAIAAPSLLARAALGQGGEYVLAEIREELVGVLREALAALGEPTQLEGQRLRARVLARLAAALTPSRTPEEPLQLAREALAMTAQETDARTRIDVDVGVGSALMGFARPAERLPVNERLLRDARAVGDRVLRLRALTRIVCDHLERGDISSADAVIGARSSLADAIGHPRYRWQTPLLRSMRAMPDGRFADCESEIAEARSIASEASDPNAQRCIELHRFTMLLVAGRTQDLHVQQAATLREIDSLADGSMLRNWVTALVTARLGERARCTHVLSSLGTTSLILPRSLRTTLTEAAVLCGARELYDRLYATFDVDDDSNGAWGPLALACGPPIARVLAAVAFAQGRSDVALSHCERALALSERMDASAFRAWVQLTWGEGQPSAREHLESARKLAEKLNMPDVLARASAALSGGASAHAKSVKALPSIIFTLRREGSEWLIASIASGGNTFRLKDIRGLGMLASLIERPGQEIHVLDLAADATADTSTAIDLGDAGELIDLKAREAYKRRMAELRDEIEEADRFNDRERASRLRYELDALTDQVVSAVGLGGRERRSGSASERARIVVQRRVREAIKKIADLDDELGRHLDWSVRTGTFCVYEPEGRRGVR